MSPTKGTGPALYVLASDEEEFRENDVTVGWTVKTTQVPANEPYYMSTLSNNFLPNVLTTMDAEQSSHDQVFANSNQTFFNRFF